MKFQLFLDCHGLAVHLKVSYRTSQSRFRLIRTYFLQNQVLLLTHKHDFRCGRRPTAWLCKLCQEALILCKREGHLHFLDKTPTQTKKSQLRRFLTLSFHIYSKSQSTFCPWLQGSFPRGYLTHPFFCLRIWKCWLRINKAHLYTTNSHLHTSKVLKNFYIKFQ